MPLVHVSQGQHNEKKYDRTDVIVNPSRPAIAMAGGFDPLKEVMDNLRAHTVSNNYNFLSLDVASSLDVHF